VDFRFQSSGVGSKTVEWGIMKSKELGLSMMTEASPVGAAFYSKHDFEKLGVWALSLSSSESLTLIVMSRSV
jgi:hypothetical protein